jgi:hypothetical protein
MPLRAKTNISQTAIVRRSQVGVADKFKVYLQPLKRPSFPEKTGNDVSLMGATVHPVKTAIFSL